jgi:hypothetical protein
MSTVEFPGIQNRILGALSPDPSPRDALIKSRGIESAFPSRARQASRSQIALAT